MYSSGSLSGREQRIGESGRSQAKGMAGCLHVCVSASLRLRTRWPRDLSVAASSGGRGPAILSCMAEREPGAWYSSWPSARQRQLQSHAACNGCCTWQTLMLPGLHLRRAAARGARDWRGRLAV